FREVINDALKHAKSLGASDATAEVAESCGLSVSVRNQDIETVEQNRDRGLSVTVYAGQRRGSAATSEFCPAALRETVEAAWHIARYTAEDAAAELPDVDQLATEFPDLDLYHPWDITTDQAVELAASAEQSAREHSTLITNSEGASVDTYQGHFVLGNTRGFVGGYPYTRHSIAVSPIAGSGTDMQRDYWYSAARSESDLADAQYIGQYAA